MTFHDEEIGKVMWEATAVFPHSGAKMLTSVIFSADVLLHELIYFAQ